MKRKLLLVGIDGVTWDIASEEWVATTLMQWSCDGAAIPVWMEVPTTSGPGWASLLTGATHAQHGVRDNEFTAHRLQYHPDILSRVWFADHHARTLCAVSWPSLADPAGPGPVIHSRVDQQRRGQHQVVIRSSIPHGAEQADREVATLAARVVHDEGPDASFVYFEGVDEAGHVHGASSTQYRTAISIVDGYLRPLLQAVEHRATLGEDWLVAVTTDHGQTGEPWSRSHGGDSEAERRSFLVLRSVGAPLEIDLPQQLDAHQVMSFLLSALA